MFYTFELGVKQTIRCVSITWPKPSVFVSLRDAVRQLVMLPVVSVSGHRVPTAGTHTRVLVQEFIPSCVSGVVVVLLHFGCEMTSLHEKCVLLTVDKQNETFHRKLQP